ncbi:MAG: hypothetical protein WDA20_04070 [Desulfuromonadales bacterium]
MTIFRKTCALFAALVLSAGMLACEQQGPAEKAGEQADKAVENTRDTVQDTIDGQGPGEKTGEKIDKTLDGNKR